MKYFGSTFLLSAGVINILNTFQHQSVQQQFQLLDPIQVVPNGTTNEESALIWSGDVRSEGSDLGSWRGVWRPGSRRITDGVDNMLRSALHSSRHSRHVPALEFVPLLQTFVTRSTLHFDAVFLRQRYPRHQSSTLMLLESPRAVKLRRLTLSTRPHPQAQNRRRKTDARRAIHETRERLERLQLLEIEYTLKKRLREDSDASHEGQGYVPVDMCGGGSQPLSLATKPFQRPQHKRPLWDKSLLWPYVDYVCGRSCLLQRWMTVRLLGVRLSTLPQSHYSVNPAEWIRSLLYDHTE